MDILLIFYYILFLVLITSPFLWFSQSLKHKEYNREVVEMNGRKSLLLENLRDLKIEVDTQKISQQEFLELSKDIVLELKQIDQKLSTIKEIPKNQVCSNCSNSITLPEANFCHICGNKLVKV